MNQKIEIEGLERELTNVLQDNDNYYLYIDKDYIQLDGTFSFAEMKAMAEIISRYT